MANTTQRATFSLDERTLQRIRQLASLWHVSQAEVIRRAVADAEPGVAPDSVAMLNELHSVGAGLSAAKAKAYLVDVRKDRKQWREK